MEMNYKHDCKKNENCIWFVNTDFVLINLCNKKPNLMYVPGKPPW